MCRAQGPGPKYRYPTGSGALTNHRGEGFRADRLGNTMVRVLLLAKEDRCSFRLSPRRLRFSVPNSVPRVRWPARPFGIVMAATARIGRRLCAGHIRRPEPRGLHWGCMIRLVALDRLRYPGRTPQFNRGSSPGITEREARRQRFRYCRLRRTVPTARRRSSFIFSRFTRSTSCISPRPRDCAGKPSPSYFAPISLPRQRSPASTAAEPSPAHGDPVSPQALRRTIVADQAARRPRR
jgi:hypothetical protein